MLKESESVVILCKFVTSYLWNDLPNVNFTYRHATYAAILYQITSAAPKVVVPWRSSLYETFDSHFYEVCLRRGDQP